MSRTLHFEIANEQLQILTHDQGGFIRGQLRDAGFRDDLPIRTSYDAGRDVVAYEQEIPDEPVFRINIPAQSVQSFENVLQGAEGTIDRLSGAFRNVAVPAVPAREFSNSLESMAAAFRGEDSRRAVSFMPQAAAAIPTTAQIGRAYRQAVESFDPATIANVDFADIERRMVSYMDESIRSAFHAGLLTPEEARTAADLTPVDAALTTLRNAGLPETVFDAQALEHMRQVILSELIRETVRFYFIDAGHLFKNGDVVYYHHRQGVIENANQEGYTLRMRPEHEVDIERLKDLKRLASPEPQRKMIV